MRGRDRRLWSRLDALERATPDGCDVCRGWTGTVLCDDAGDCLRAEQCPQCGRRVPIDQVVDVSGFRLAAL